MWVEITLIGCDDSTEFDLEVNKKEYELLKKVEKKSKEHSCTHCMPRFEVLIKE